jgi:hypothetical protein
MTKESVKVRLIRELDRRAFYASDRGLAAYYKLQANELRARGSGALPWWAKQFAREWGIE